MLWMQVARGGGVRTVSVLGDRRVPELEQLTALLRRVQVATAIASTSIRQPGWASVATPISASAGL